MAAGAAGCRGPEQRPGRGGGTSSGWRQQLQSSLAAGGARAARTCSQRRVSMSHTRMVLSAEAENSLRPCTSTAHTISSWPCGSGGTESRGGARRPPRCTFQRCPGAWRAGRRGVQLQHAGPPARALGSRRQGGHAAAP
jgi:hypothetical protein